MNNRSLIIFLISLIAANAASALTPLSKHEDLEMLALQVDWILSRESVTAAEMLDPKRMLIARGILDDEEWKKMEKDLGGAMHVAVSMEGVGVMLVPFERGEIGPGRLAYWYSFDAKTKSRIRSVLLQKSTNP